MDIKFPVFIKDTEGYMELITSDQTLNWLEYNDVYNNEYTAWDANGLPIELYLEGKEIKAKYSSNKEGSEKLDDAIKKYVAIVKRENAFEYSGPEGNPVDLFAAIKKHLSQKKGKKW